MPYRRPGFRYAASIDPHHSANLIDELFRLADMLKQKENFSAVRMRRGGGYYLETEERIDEETMREVFSERYLVLSPVEKD